MRTIEVAAAADLSTASRDIAEVFESTASSKVRLTFDSSGALASQLRGGRPFDVFASANAGFVEEVVRGGECFGDTKLVYARGRLALWGLSGTSLPERLADLRDPAFGTVAIADPERAPYGAAARQALEGAGVWADIQDRIVECKNVHDALELARSGRSKVAVVALSLAVVAEGVYTLVDTSLYSMLDQVVVICNSGPLTDDPKRKISEQFVSFLVSEVARSILRRHGFLVPGESTDFE